MSETEKIIVLVQDSGDASHGEISVLDGWDKAERLIETLLEAGFERERVHVFKGRQNEFKISHRPVVSFAGDAPQAGEARSQPAAQRPAAAVSEPASRAEAPVAAEAQQPKPEADPAEPAATREPEPVAQAKPAEEQPEQPRADEPASEAEAGGEEEAPAEEAEEAAAPVRFSSLFRSA